MCVSAHCGKEKEAAGEWGHAEEGQQFSRTNILILVLGNKHNAEQLKGKNEAKKWAQTIKGGDQDHQRSLKPSDPFPEGPEKMD